MKDRIDLKAIKVFALLLVMWVAQTSHGKLKTAWLEVGVGSVTDAARQIKVQQERVDSELLVRDEAMDKNKINPKELLKEIRTLKESGMYIQGEIPEDGPEADMLAKMLYQKWIEEKGNVSASIPEGSTTGKLDIYVLRDSETWDHRSNETDRHLDVLEGSEWIALFRDVLKCPMGIDQPFAPGDDLEEWRERKQIKFQQAIPDYPMLGRIWDTFIDTTYYAEEVGQLRNECLKVQTTATNPVALQGLGKLIAACDEALTLGSDLHLACD